MAKLSSSAATLGRAAIKLDWNLGFAQLTSNTSFFDRNQHSTSHYSQYAASAQDLSALQQLTATNSAPKAAAHLGRRSFSPCIT